VRINVHKLGNQSTDDVASVAVFLCDFFLLALTEPVFDGGAVALCVPFSVACAVPVPSASVAEAAAFADDVADFTLRFFTRFAFRLLASSRVVDVAF